MRDARQKRAIVTRAHARRQTGRTAAQHYRKKAEDMARVRQQKRAAEKKQRNSSKGGGADLLRLQAGAAGRGRRCHSARSLAATRRDPRYKSERGRQLPVSAIMGLDFWD